MLDIIIPAYKDPDGLRRTLKSVYCPKFDWIKVTVVDDCSPIKYDDIEKEFPNVTFYHLSENHGPGYARQFGIEHTSEPYFFFIDCGDTFLSKYLFLEVRDTLRKYSDRYLFLWVWIREGGHLSDKRTRSTQGWVYARKFFDLYNVKFCTNKLGGYSNEDVGFNHTCTTIIKSLELRDNKLYSCFSDIPIYRKVHNDDSLTCRVNYIIEKQIPGLVTNAIQCIHQLEDANIDTETLVEEINILMFSLYKDFLRCAKYGTPLLQSHWELIRKFYFEIYQRYEDLEENEININRNMGWYLKELKEFIATPNIRRFLRELKDNKNCPEHYINLR